MADRLAELLRQRALLQEHLEWLDAEIAAASGRGIARTQPAQPPRPAPAPSAVIATQILARATPPPPAPENPQSAFRAVVDPAGAMLAEAAAGVGDEIIDQYRSSPDSLKTDVRKGCFLYFAAAFLVLGLVVAALWFAFRSQHQDDVRQTPMRVERRP